MQTVAVFVALLAAAGASTIFRVPSADSAVISSQRLGGNFAYSVAENEAYGIVNPVVSHVTSPVATTYTVQQPGSVVSTVQQPGAVTYSALNTVPQQVVSGYTAVDTSSPIIYNAKTNVEGVEVEKQINQVHTVQQVQPIAQVATTYAVQQPQVQTYAVQQPQVQTYAVQQPQVQTYAVQQPQVQTYAVQQPSVSTYAVQQVQQVPQVATTYAAVQQVPQVQTYSVQQPATTVVSSGTPIATTYNTVAGVPAVSNFAYGYGQPWGVNTVGQPLVWNGVNTVGGQTVFTNGVNTVV